MREGPLDCVAAPGSFWGRSTHCGDEIWGQLAPTVWPPPVTRASGSSDPHTQRAIGSTPGPLLTGSGSPHTLTQLAGTAGATGCSPRSGVGRDPDTERGSQQELADAASSTFRLGSERPGCALSARESPAFYYSARCARKRTRPPPPASSPGARRRLAVPSLVALTVSRSAHLSL